MLHDTLIIGGGASGLLAACALTQLGRRAILLEKQPRVGRKLLSTGNGRCNLTNVNARPAHYHGARAAARMALLAHPPREILERFDALGVPCSPPDEEGRVYPMSHQAASVLDALRLWLDESGVAVRTDFAVSALAAIPGGFEARAASGEAVRGRTALVCTGGLAAPKLGASGEGYRLLEGFGHTIAPRFPALAPLKTPPEAVRGLKGIRAEGWIALEQGEKTLRAERGEMLFTEYGVSGIAAMQLSRAAGEALRAGGSCRLRLNFLPQWPLDDDALPRHAEEMLTRRAQCLPARPLDDFLNGIVPRRLGQTLVRATGLDPQRAAGTLISDAGKRELRRLAAALTGWTLPLTGVQGFDQAQVTAGGARLSDFDARTLQSLRAPGLFAAGEVLDVDGDCGGFNLQWTWSSALTASEGIDQYLRQKG